MTLFWRMFAVIKTGGKQYVVEPGKKLKIEKLNTQSGKPVTFNEVLLVSDGKKIDPVRSQTPGASADAPAAHRTSNGTRIGTPLIQGASVTGTIAKQGRARKQIVFRYHAKTRYRKKKGHRQPFTEIEITGVSS